jgi:hypothetical protein
MIDSRIEGDMWKSFWEWFAAQPPSSASFVGTLTGSALGLFALLCGAMFNAHLNRRRDDALRSADRITLATALYAELQGVHRTLLDNADGLSKRDSGPDGGFLVPEPTVKVFPVMLPKLGLLSADAVRKVMDAYILNEEYIHRLVIRGGTMQTQMPPNRQTIYIEACHKEFVVRLNRVTAGVVQEAMNALKRYF